MELDRNADLMQFLLNPRAQSKTWHRDIEDEHVFDEIKKTGKDNGSTASSCESEQSPGFATSEVTRKLKFQWDSAGSEDTQTYTTIYPGHIRVPIKSKMTYARAAHSSSRPFALASIKKENISRNCVEEDVETTSEKDGSACEAKADKSCWTENEDKTSCSSMDSSEEVTPSSPQFFTSEFLSKSPPDCTLTHDSDSSHLQTTGYPGPDDKKGLVSLIQNSQYYVTQAHGNGQNIVALNDARPPAKKLINNAWRRLILEDNQHFGGRRACQKPIGQCIICDEILVDHILYKRLLNNFYQSKICFDFAKYQTCRYGENCRYVHQPH
ncbi:unnamed protein product [Bursaphelenchus xylophilus]|uniref:(pine wood nematode) hypothetical protein n=1 Tax=Bursaphelenchus xylophilus TaxID=6326 RepID=A0A1I7S0Y3_BURXY|nr:unnamed protein product [Bursaphelenchus xylophilus]CAG9087879.1 unnamed protein product [Bursaphelenchus xylophilus]